LNSLFKFIKEPYFLHLVDNGSSDGTYEYFSSLKKYNIKTVRYEQNMGFIIPNNDIFDQILQQNEDWDILLLNNDIEILDNRLLIRLQEELHSESNVGLTFPINKTRGIKYCGGLIEGQTERLLNYDTDDRFIQPTWAQFSCVLIKSEILRKVGTFDMLYNPAYFEDVDLSLRMVDAGYSLKLVPDIVVEHYQSVTSKSLNLEKLRFSNREKFYKK
jgi:GT2 family glycosyltransferase